MNGVDALRKAQIETEIELRRGMDEAILKALARLEARIAALEERADAAEHNRGHRP